MDLLRCSVKREKSDFFNFLPSEDKISNVIRKHACKKKKKKKKYSKKNRCAFPDCRKKLKLSDYPCKCELIFCTLHRLPEKHQCTWNFKSEKELNNYKKKSGLLENAKFKKFERISPTHTR